MIFKTHTGARRAIVVSSLVSATALTLLAAHAQKAHTSSATAPTCKISPVEAIKIALKKTPGRALNANFEFDEGKWVYGVTIVSGKIISEVEIDPMTGKVDDSETVTPDGEARELRAELARAIGVKNTVSGSKEDSERE